MKEFSAVVVLFYSNEIHADSTRAAYTCLDPLVLLFVALLLVDFSIGIVVIIFYGFVIAVLSFKVLIKLFINFSFEVHTGSPQTPRCFFK